MKLHFEFFQVKPVLGFTGVQVMVEVTSCIAKTMELPVWGQKDGGRRLLIGHARVSTLPTPGKATNHQSLYNTC